MAEDDPDVVVLEDLLDEIPQFGTIEDIDKEEEDKESKPDIDNKPIATDQQDNHLQAEEQDTQSINGQQEDSIHAEDMKHGSSPDKPIRLSVVVCGDRSGETLVMLKSAVIFSHTYQLFHLFADDHAKKELSEELDKWPAVKSGRIQYLLHSIAFPEGQDAEQWKKLFKPCASQRLFLPDILADVDSLIYVDTDILFLTPIETLWEHFYQFNSSHAAALAPEGEDLPTGWYNRFARHPYYGVLGVNSGIMLMNLTRLRAMKWVERVLKYYEEYRYAITWGDQDLINVIFHYHPDKLYIYPCEWNFRPDHCRVKNACPGAFNRIYMLHGNRQLFHKKNQQGMEGFITIYNTLEKHIQGNNIRESVLEPLRRLLPQYKTENYCSEMVNAMLHSVEDTVNTACDLDSC